MRTLSLLVVGAIAMAAVVACGGKVVVDGHAGSGGAGGASNAGGAGGSPNTTSSGCGFPPPIGALVGCSAVASSGPGGPVMCSTALCDSASNSFQSDCTDASCTCTFFPAQGTETISCSCALLAACDMVPNDCCPFHF